VAGGEIAASGAAASAERRTRIRHRLADEGFAALLVTALPDVRYLSGFTGSSGVLVVGADERDDVFLTDFRYRDQAGDEIDPALEVRIVSKGPLAGAREALGEAGLAPVAFERDHVTVGEWESWREEEGPELRGVEGWVAELRAVKSADEVAAISRAADVAGAAFEEFLPLVRAGAVERELALELDRQLVLAGAERPAFETIVASGPRAALPHARPSDRRIAPDDVVLFDFGAVVDGYHSDITRTVALGEPPEEIARVYRIVHEAQRVALEGLRGGLPGRQADALARDVIEEAGYGEAFGHSLGHGIGLEVHEAPRLSRLEERELPVGAVVTVEPGVYISGVGGVRIEDDVVLEPHGVRVLTKPAPASMLVL